MSNENSKRLGNILCGKATITGPDGNETARQFFWRCGKHWKTMSNKPRKPHMQRTITPTRIMALATLFPIRWNTKE